MVALSSPGPRQLDRKDALFRGGIAGLWLGFCLAIQGLWAGSMLHQVAIPQGANSRNLAAKPTADLVASGTLDKAAWASGIGTATQPDAPASGQPARGERGRPLPAFIQTEFKGRSFDTRDWLFIVSWQASRGAHGGMRASSVAPSTSQGKQRHEATETVAWLLQP